jgi:predicted transcriptional regulator of viral defense system
MATKIAATRSTRAWALARRQHGVLTRQNLAALGSTPGAIRHRLAIGRLHRVRPGIYAVGRRELTREGRWMAAVLACGPDAVLSHGSAAALWGIGRRET